MARRTSIIGRQTIDLLYSSREKSHALQNTVSAIFKRDIHPGIESLIDRIVPSDRFLKIDTLTIDIGTIDQASLETELSRRILEKLEQEIRLLIQMDNRSADHGDSPYEGSELRSYLELLDHFLLTGTLPWWAGGDQWFSPSSVLEELIKKDPTALRAMLIAAAKSSVVRQRLVSQFSEKEIKSIITVLEPAEAEFIFDYHSRVVTIQKEKQVLKAEISVFERAVWEFIIAYLAVDRGSHFNRKEFVRANIMAMARHFNIDYFSLLSLFASAIIREKSRLQQVDTLQSIIFELSADRPTLQQQLIRPDGTVPAKSDQDRLEHTGKVLRYFLESGSLPWWENSLSKDDIIAMMKLIIRSIPATTEQIIRHTGKMSSSRRLLVETFPEPILEHIVMVLEPENAEYINDYIEQVRETQQKESPVKAQGEDFMLAVWEFVFDYLLYDQGSLFNRKMFVESNVRRLARRYNADVLDILRFLVKNIAVTRNNSSRHLALFHDLSIIHQERLQALPVQGPAGAPKAPELVQAEFSQSRLGDLNTLLFWLESGSLPWWGRKVDPATLFEKMMESSAGDLQLFLRRAALRPEFMKRVLIQLPPQSLIKAFQLIVKDAGITNYFEQMRVYFLKSKIPGLRDSVTLHQHLILAMWNQLAESDYQTFSVSATLKHFLHLAARWHKLSLKRVVRSVSVLPDEPIAAIMLTIAESGAATTDNILSDLLSDTGYIDTEELVEELLASFMMSEGIGTPEEAARQILKWFIERNTLPGHFEKWSSILRTSVLKSLTALIQKSSPHGLEELVLSASAREDSLLRLFDFFAGTVAAEGTAERAIADLLEKGISLQLSRRMDDPTSVSTLAGLADRYFGMSAAAPMQDRIRLLLKYPAISIKLALVYPDDLVYQMISGSELRVGWGSGTVSYLQNLQHWFSSRLTDQLDRDRILMLLRTFNFMMFGGAVEYRDSRSFLDSFLRFVYQQDYQLLLRMSREFGQKPVSEAIQEGVFSVTEQKELQAAFGQYQQLETDTRASRSALEQLEQELLRKAYPYREEELAREEEQRRKELERLREEEAARKKKMPDYDKIYIRNAGLVLLHPFLSTYFNRLGMLEKGDFISEEIRHRAVHLLQYIAFETSRNEEHELLLNKLLCNVPPEDPVPLEIELTEQEIKVSAELLQAVIQQWDKMKNSSLDNFRASFLQREGMLYKIEDNWNLKVEERGYDVLLQTLPWGLGMVKTSWMNDFIYVEWN